MLPNIRRHSLLVAHIATRLAERASKRGMDIDVPGTHAAGLLHDLAKTYCLRYGGGHATLGAAWVVQETGNYAVAQGVLLHVHWPWELPPGNAVCQLPLLVQYADKRVRHDQCVTLEQRFQDLLVRYGKTEQAREGIRCTLLQASMLERAISQQLDCDLHEDTFDCGRLVF